MHHNKLQAVHASNDNLAAASNLGAASTGDQPQHCALSREASLKKGSDGKCIMYYGIWKKFSGAQSFPWELIDGALHPWLKTTLQRLVGKL